MPSPKIRTPILGGKYYHIFNRGINGQTIFFQERNYKYFLELVGKYLSGYVDFLAYSLLSNHFHMVIRIKEEIKISRRDSISKKKMESIVSDENEIGLFVSNQFRSLFITFSMAINKQENRTGSLLDKNFKRLEISNEDYLKYVIFYTHFNPVKHGLTVNIEDYRFSSYQSFLTNKTTQLQREHVFDIFNGLEGFINYHSVMHDERMEVVLE